jgi:hypothetical protein
MPRIIFEFHGKSMITALHTDKNAVVFDAGRPISILDALLSCPVAHRDLAVFAFRSRSIAVLLEALDTSSLDDVFQYASTYNEALLRRMYSNMSNTEYLDSLAEFIAAKLKPVIVDDRTAFCPRLKALVKGGIEYETIAPHQFYELYKVSYNDSDRFKLINDSTALIIGLFEMFEPLPTTVSRVEALAYVKQSVTNLVNATFAIYDL